MNNGDGNDNKNDKNQSNSEFHNNRSFSRSFNTKFQKRTSSILLVILTISDLLIAVIKIYITTMITKSRKVIL